MLSHNEYVIWTIKNKTLWIAVSICNNADMPVTYLKGMDAFKEGYYNCYSFYSGAMTIEQAKKLSKPQKLKKIEKYRSYSRNILILIQLYAYTKISDLHSLLIWYQMNNWTASKNHGACGLSKLQGILRNRCRNRKFTHTICLLF